MSRVILATLHTTPRSVHGAHLIQTPDSVKTLTLCSDPNPQLRGSSCCIRHMQVHVHVHDHVHSHFCFHVPTSHPHPHPHCHIRQRTHRSGHLKLSGPTQLLSCRGGPDLRSKPKPMAHMCMVLYDVCRSLHILHTVHKSSIQAAIAAVCHRLSAASKFLADVFASFGRYTLTGLDPGGRVPPLRVP